jgi:hypothetical protein
VEVTGASVAGYTVDVVVLEDSISMVRNVFTPVRLGSCSSEGIKLVWQVEINLHSLRRGYWRGGSGIRRGGSTIQY